MNTFLFAFNQFLFFIFSVVVLHEFGHLIVAKISNYKLEEISILFVKYDFLTRKLSFKINIFQNYVRVTPNTEKNILLYFSIGIIINITLGIIFILLRDFNYIFLMTGIQSLFVGFINLIPKWKSDGHFIFMILFPNKFPFDET